MPTPYVYKVTNNETGEFYVGSRKANVSSNRTAIDDFRVHYFTSGKLRHSLINHPEKFSHQILFHYGDADVVYWYEQLLIREHINNVLCLNQHYIDPDSECKAFNNGGWNKGISPSTETRQKYSLAGKGRLKSESHKKKISSSNVGKHSKMETCIHCGTTSIRTNIIRYHNENCNSVTHYHTPFGSFKTSYEAAEATGISQSGIMNMCKNHERTISAYSLRKCKQLKAEFIDQTYKSVGFYFS